MFTEVSTSGLSRLRRVGRVGSLEPRSGVYASSGATRYDGMGGGVTDLGECLIVGYFMLRS